MDDSAATYDRARGAHALTETEWQERMLRECPSTFRVVNGEPEPTCSTPPSRWARLKLWLFGQ